MGEIYTISEVSKHNTIKDCWVILYGNIYDVTKFIPKHPGGANAILQLAGKDATEAFDLVHPAGTLAENLTPESLVGTLEATATTTAVPHAAVSGNTCPSVQCLLNLDDIEEVATQKLSKKAWAYYYSAADDKITKRMNSEAFRSILLRPRIFVDCAKCRLDTTFLGHTVSMPIYVAPAAQARLGHLSGEAGIADACRSVGALQIISNSASMAPEQIVARAAPGQIFGWQLYVQNDRSKSERMIARINKLDRIKFLVLTLDTPVAGKREDDQRWGNVINTITDTDYEASQQISEKEVFAGFDPTLTWKETLTWLGKHTNLPIILKGVQTHEDAQIASFYRPQVKGVILSNHGGRSLDTSPPAIYTLLEIRHHCPEVFHNIDVWVDGGVRRGTDVVKALCLGAKGVGIGRAALWGLSAGGADGVKRVFQILADETKTCMRLLGVQRVDQLGLQHVNVRRVEQQIYLGPSALGPHEADHSSKL